MSVEMAEGNFYEAYGAPPNVQIDGSFGSMFDLAGTPVTVQNFAMIMELLTNFQPGWTVQPNGRVTGPPNPVTGRTPTLGWMEPSRAFGVPGQTFSYNPNTGTIYGSGWSTPIGRMNPGPIDPLAIAQLMEGTVNFSFPDGLGIALGPNMNVPGVNPETCICPNGKLQFVVRRNTSGNDGNGAEGSGPNS